MDFGATLARVLGFLEQHHHRGALVGGLALAAYGMPRATLDVDVVTERAAQEALVGHLEALGYETLHRSAGYSNHLHPDRRWGRVDVVYVDEATAEKLFAAVRELAGPGGGTVPVAAPQHLAAMKVLALKNDPSRAAQDLADLRFLLTLPEVDRTQVRESLARHGLAHRYDALLEDA